jgi:hypothetical protein
MWTLEIRYVDGGAVVFFFYRRAQFSTAMVETIGYEKLLLTRYPLINEASYNSLILEEFTPSG